MKTTGDQKKVALVTGSTRGIGLAIARRLIDDGFRVVTNAKSEPLERVGEKFIQADLTDPQQIDEMAEIFRKDFGQIDVLVCNVGSGKQIDSLESAKRWNHYMAINLFSATNLIQAMLNLNILKTSKIIGISSIAGVTSTSAPFEYSASKAALISYFKNMAVANIGSGLNFNLINVGNIMFPGSTWDIQYKSNKEIVTTYLRDKVPANRFGTIEEIADVASFLASTQCDFMTGAMINVDGGQSL